MLCGMTTDEVLSPSAVSFIRTTVPRAAEYVALMKKRGRGSVRDLRWLWRMIEDYPHDAFAAALEEALSFGMVDLERLERMVLRRVDRDFFVLPRRPHRGDPR